MQVIKINNIQYTAPGSWDELSVESLLHLSQVLLCRNLDDRQTNHQLAMRLFKVPFKIFAMLPESLKMQIHPCLNWIFTKNTLNKWLISRVKIGNSTYYGPADKLSNITGAEFMQCERAWAGWITDQNTDHLTTLMAVLYRKRRFLSTKRVDFDAVKLKSHEKLFVTAKPWLKHAVATNYAGIRNLMIDCHPHIWKQSIAQAGESDNKQTSWAKIFLDMSGEKFGPYPDTINSNIWLLLSDLNSKAEAYDNATSNK